MADLKRSAKTMRALILSFILVAVVGCARKSEPSWTRELLWAKETPEGFCAVSLDHHGSFGGEGGPGFLMIEFRTRNLRPEAVGVHGARTAYLDAKEYEGAFSVQLELTRVGSRYRLDEKILGRRWSIDPVAGEVALEK